uniref:Putative secreted peptide n=1 Tax=Anopheles braziliensis TaxID=58242 RepID=A0A2M3ZT06_9DIPT
MAPLPPYRCCASTSAFVSVAVGEGEPPSGPPSSSESDRNVSWIVSGPTILNFSSTVCVTLVSVTTFSVSTTVM